MASSSVGVGDSSPIKISKRIKKELHQLKVVIRQLPPDFTEEKLLERISPLPPHTHFYFMAGDAASLGPHGFSRAYLTFSNEADALPFRDQFDGCVFESEKGVKYRTVIEYAPYQGTPKRVGKRKPDPRCGTIEQDAEYLAFLETYEAEPATSTGIDISTYMIELETGRTPRVQMTPLLKYLKEKRQAKLAAKARNKLYVSDSKKKKGDSKRGSKSKGSTSEKEGSKGGEVTTYRTRKEEREKKKRDSELAAKSSGASKDREIAIGNHVSDEQPKSKKQDHADKPTKSSKEVRSFHDDRRGSSSSKTGSDSHYENGEIKEEKGRGGRRNKERPDKAIYNPRSNDRDQTSASSKTKDDDRMRSKEDFGPHTPPRFSKDRFVDHPSRREKGDRSSLDDWDGSGGGKGGGGGGRRGKDRRGARIREEYGRAAQSGGYESRSKSSSYYRDK